MPIYFENEVAGGNGKDVSGDGTVRLDPNRKREDPTPAFDPSTLFDDEGRMLKGQFDAGDDHRFTADFLESNPHVSKLLEAQVNSRKKITELTQGKVALAEPLTDDVWRGISFQRDEKGEIPEATIKALEGRPITRREIEFVFETVERAAEVASNANRQWQAGWYEKLGDGDSVDGKEKFNELISWAEQNLPEEDLQDVNAALATRKYRDQAMQDLWNQFTERNTVPQPANPLRTGSSQTSREDSADGSAFTTTGFYPKDPGTRQAEYTRDRALAGRDRSKIEAVDAKLERSMKHWGQA